MVYGNRSDDLSILNLNASGNSSYGIDIYESLNPTIMNVNASSTGSAGIGIRLSYTTGGQISGNTINGRSLGLQFARVENNTTITDNDFSGNSYGISEYGGGYAKSGNVITNNDFSDSASWGMRLGNQPDVVFTGNDFTNSTNAIWLLNMDSITVSDKDFSAMNIQNSVLLLENITNSTVSNVDASGTGNAGIGITLFNTSGNVITGNTVHGRSLGLQFARVENNTTITDNDFSGNSYGISEYGGGYPKSGNVITNNDFSDSASWGMRLGNQPDVVFTGNNYTNSTNAIWLLNMDSITVSDKDFSVMNIQNNVLFLEKITNSTISNVNASGTGNVGIGITLSNTSGNVITSNTVHGRSQGLQFARVENDTTITDNDFSGNSYGISEYGGGYEKSGNVIRNNDVSNSGTWGITLGRQPDFVLTGNDFTGSTHGLRLMNMDSITVSDKDFSAMDIPGTVLGLVGVTNSTVNGINASGSSGTGTGIGLFETSGILLEENIVHGRVQGVHLERSENYVTIVNNDFSGNNYGIRDYLSSATKVGTVITDNDVTNSGTWGISIANHSDFVLMRNDFTDCTNGLQLSKIDSATLSDWDFSTMNIPGTVLGLYHLTNSTVTGINASGTLGTGTGIGMYYTSDNLFTGNVVHGRASGMQLSGEEERNTISANDFSNNNSGIRDYSHSLQKTDNVIVDNDVSASSYRGISLANHFGSLVRGNTIANSTSAIVLYRGSENQVIGNLISSSQHAGLKAESESGLLINGNSVNAGQSEGLMLIDSAYARIYHNNIHDNTGYQVYSDQPIELSYGNEGNYWGRICEPDDILFIAGTDSNELDVLDSFPYASADAWLEELDPGCTPPPLALVNGTVTDNYGGVPGTTIGLSDAGGLLTDYVTDAYGSYEFPELE
ncbi:MAG: right-handed parallel beta-helix repeat-containing protein, partial [Gammaproteobacteria bacterium]|nr:right-handed parallel beta-helix repeat-containing protein [Gammaproteobacteria bacterium]